MASLVNSNNSLDIQRDMERLHNILVMAKARVQNALSNDSRNARASIKPSLSNKRTHPHETDSRSNELSYKHLKNREVIRRDPSKRVLQTASDPRKIPDDSMDFSNDQNVKNSDRSSSITSEARVKNRLHSILAQVHPTYVNDRSLLRHLDESDTLSRSTSEENDGEYFSQLVPDSMSVSISSAPFIDQPLDKKRVERVRADEQRFTSTSNVTTRTDDIDSLSSLLARLRRSGRTISSISQQVHRDEAEFMRLSDRIKQVHREFDVHSSLEPTRKPYVMPDIETIIAKTSHRTVHTPAVSPKQLKESSLKGGSEDDILRAVVEDVVDALLDGMT
jgi:hypothetical protein